MEEENADKTYPSPEVITKPSLRELLERELAKLFEGLRLEKVQEKDVDKTYPSPEVITVQDIKPCLRELLEKVQEEDANFLITEHKKAVAMLVPIYDPIDDEDYKEVITAQDIRSRLRELLKQIQEEDAEFLITKYKKAVAMLVGPPISPPPQQADCHPTEKEVEVLASLAQRNIAFMDLITIFAKIKKIKRTEVLDSLAQGDIAFMDLITIFAKD